MIVSEDLPIDQKYPESCLYWIYHEDKHVDPKVHGYVGVAVKGAERRFNRHKSEAKLGSHLIVHRAIIKYGDKIKVKVLLKADPEFCLLTEAMLRPVAHIAWNMGAGGGSPSIGYVPTQETRDKISAATKGKTVSQEVRERLRLSNTGKKLSEEARLKMSLSSKGKPKNLTDEQLARKSQALKDRSIWMTQEIRDKISAANKGKVISDEHKKAVSDALKGVPKSAEHSQRISASLTGLKKSPEHVQKMRESQLLLQQTKFPWNHHKANKDAWALAAEITNYLRTNLGCSSGKLAKMFSVPSRSYLVTLIRDFKAGWNPSEDAEWLAFKEAYNNKEASETTSTN